MATTRLVAHDSLLLDDDGGGSDQSVATPRTTADRGICREEVEGAPPGGDRHLAGGALGDRRGGLLVASQGRPAAPGGRGRQGAAEN